MESLEEGVRCIDNVESSKAPLTPGQVRQIRGIDVHECGGESGREEGGGGRGVWEA